MAEELIELGQISAPMTAPTAANTPPSARSITITPKEGELLIRVVDSIVAFSRSFPIEFHSYCPRERWDPILQKAGAGVAQIERQISERRPTIVTDTSTVTAVMDLEECVSAARDRRLSAAKAALMISAAGAIGEVALGLPWLGIPAYLISLALVLGQPLAEKVKDAAEEPFKPDVLSGRKRMGEQADKAKIIERVILSSNRRIQRYYWGTVEAAPVGPENALCLAKGEFRVRVEGWVGDRITLTEGWNLVPLSDCLVAKHEIAVWEPCAGPPRSTAFGPISRESGHENTIWAEYVGPLTGGICRKAGPFCCKGDAAQHALEDGGVTDPGGDGGYVLFDRNGQVVDQGA